MRRVFEVVLLSLVSGSVLAHSPVAGLNQFYNGLLHPLLVPTQLLVLLSLGLLLGQQKPADVRVAPLVIPTAAVVGLLVTLWVPVINVDVYLLAGATVVGLLVASKPSLRWHWCVIVGALLVLVIGIDSSQAELSGTTWLLSAAGTLIGICLLLLYAMGLATWCRSTALKGIGVRIVGSWITASAFLVFALSQISG
ncbi:HupE/UreJ family protein [Kistimonas asteriae]|uniref:HupE/UreJ family protein n=1 Tax=Kistimonas asteriae TaxID=517724 RepID=UPI001BA760F4|nr:HupE/UreJ family protein [Kistimonas asteriae]